jgi:predicted RNase H-like nuclease (RuvC/YqgF family)
MTDDSEMLSTAKPKSAKVGLGAVPSAKKSSPKNPQTTNAAPQDPQEMQRYIDLANARLTAYSAQIERLKAENLNLKRTVRHMERRILRSEHEDD